MFLSIRNKFKDINFVKSNIKRFKELEKLSLNAEDKDLLTIYESEMAQIAIILKINIDTYDKILDTRGIPLCYDFTSHYYEKYKNIIREKVSEFKSIDKRFTLIQVEKAEYSVLFLNALIYINLKRILSGKTPLPKSITIGELKSEILYYQGRSAYKKFIKKLRFEKIRFIETINDVAYTSVFYKEDIKIEVNNILGVYNKDMTLESLFSTNIGNIPFFIGKVYST